MITNLTGGLRQPKLFDRKDPVYKRILDFVKKEVQSVPKGEWFSVQSLFGGDNYDWCKLGYPIGDIWVVLNEDYEDRGFSDAEERAVKQAGIYVGMIMKYVIHNLPDKYEMKREFCHISYRKL